MVRALVGYSVLAIIGIFALRLLLGLLSIAFNLLWAVLWLAGRFATIVVHPIIQGRGILGEAKEPRMWLSDDDRRIMVQLKLKFASIATVTLRLRAVSDSLPPELLAQ